MSSITDSGLPVPMLKISYSFFILPSSILRTAKTCAFARSTMSMKSLWHVPSGVG